MKRLAFLLGLLLTFSNLVAQKKVTENSKASGINEVYVHVKFAEKIVVKNWDKNEVAVEATVNLNDNKDNDFFSLKADKIGGTYTVKSDYGKFFKRHKNSVTITHNGSDCNSYNNCSNHNEIEVNYVIYVPENMELKVKSISGTVDALSYNGKLTLDLISGNITVKKHSNTMYLKTISGDIDVVVSDAEFKAETVTGTVYSDLDIDFSKNKKRSYGSKVFGTVKKGTANLKLKTVSGDIFLRKI
ncbi:putative adhesin [Lutibacter sp. Hel_I_33_5]|uniref:DUF4097 family beta strand repeat-containing protein n=1 Tax=Lutibacter sp. Hel_I_33_5 TaxID=1566289 RepID=UPI0011A81AED|nr:DUF4097 family beta strand repeat-containing protein [Lutibacter sp. Hel_I_33_5]TVZ55947.1 putative adhesin [Lutibacter sp. Hel_I_33_5]